MEYINFSLIDYTFVFTASYLLLISYYYQNYNIYSQLINKPFILNKDAILIQLTQLNENYFNVFKFWSYQFTVFAITAILFVFNIGENFKNVFLLFSFFILLQFIIEYFFFYSNILKEKKSTGESFEAILNSYETKKDYEEILFNEYQLNNLNKIKNMLNANQIDKQLVYSFINGKESNKTDLKIEDDYIIIYNEQEEKLELDLQLFKIFKISESTTQYFNSFNELTSFNKIFLIGLLEPFFMSLLLFLTILIKI